MPSVCLVGTGDPEFERTAILTEGLRHHGLSVDVCVEPVWGATAERVVAARRGLGNPRLAQRLATAYARLAVRLRSLRPKPDILLVAHPGQLDVIALRAIAPRSHIILDSFISIDETLGDRDLGSASSLARRTARAVDRLALRFADRVVVDTAAHARRFASELGLRPARTIVVPVGARDLHPPLLGVPSPTPDAAEGQGSVAPSLRVLYFGGFIPLHGVPVILEAARLLANSGIVFELVGDGQDADAVERTLASSPLPHVNLVRTWLPPAELVARHVDRADVCLGVFSDRPKAANVVPAKVYFAMARGKAIVTADTPAVRETLMAECLPGPVLTCRAGDPAGLAAALIALRDDAPLRDRLAGAARSAYEARFRPEIVVEPLVAAIKDLSDIADA